MKKWIAVLLTLLLMILAVPMHVARADNSDIVLDDFETDPDDMEPGDSFDLTLTLKKNIDSADIKDITITINNPNVYVPVDSKPEISIGDWDGNNDMMELDPIALKFVGSTYQGLSLTIEATIGENTPFSRDESLYIDVDIPDKEDDDPPPDPTKYLPILRLDNEKMPVATAGKSFTLDLTINNTSSYSAKNITITPTYTGEGSDPFQYSTLQQSGFIERINSKKSEEIKFKYTIAPNTPTGIYNLTLNYSFFNSYSDSPSR